METYILASLAFHVLYVVLAGLWISRGKFPHTSTTTVGFLTFRMFVRAGLALWAAKLLGVL